MYVLLRRLIPSGGFQLTLNHDGGSTGGGGGSTGPTIGTGSAGQNVDRHLFCNTGVMTPICE